MSNKVVCSCIAMSNKVVLAKQEYINAKRKLKSRLNAMTYSDILRVMRQGVHGSIKN